MWMSRKGRGGDAATIMIIVVPYQQVFMCAGGGGVKRVDIRNIFETVWDIMEGT